MEEEATSYVFVPYCWRQKGIKGQELTPGSTTEEIVCRDEGVGIGHDGCSVHLCIDD